MVNDTVQPHPWWHIPDNLESVITLKQACKQYHFSKSSMMRKIYRQQIKAFKIGRRWYVMKPIVDSP
ncbi:MAG: helix-turn-helix domain-containing protein [Nostoc sp.]